MKLVLAAIAILVSVSVYAEEKSIILPFAHDPARYSIELCKDLDSKVFFGGEVTETIVGDRRVITSSGKSLRTVLQKDYAVPSWVVDYYSTDPKLLARLYDGVTKKHLMDHHLKEIEDVKLDKEWDKIHSIKKPEIIDAYRSFANYYGRQFKMMRVTANVED